MIRPIVLALLMALLAAPPAPLAAGRVGPLWVSVQAVAVVDGATTITGTIRNVSGTAAALPLDAFVVYDGAGQRYVPAGDGVVVLQPGQATPLRAIMDRTAHRWFVVATYAGERLILDLPGGQP